MKLFLATVASLFILSACHMDNRTAGDSIFKNKGNCGNCKSVCENKECQCTGCAHKKAHDHGHGHHTH